MSGPGQMEPRLIVYKCGSMAYMNVDNMATIPQQSVEHTGPFATDKSVQSSSRDQKNNIKNSELPEPTLVRKKQRVGADRICKVCGDKAVAHNFDVISCESCKTFFRRNAHKTQKGCAFQGACEITIQTRRFCPDCRLKKCFSIGMRADMILDEEERHIRMQKILTNREKRQAAARKLDPDTNASSSPKTRHVYSPDSSGDKVMRSNAGSGLMPDSLLGTTEIQFMNISTCGVQAPTNQAWPHGQCTTTTTSITAHGGGCGSCPCSGTVTSSMYGWQQTTDRRTQAFNFQHPPPSLLPSDPIMYWKLTAEEHNVMTDLTLAYKETILQAFISPEDLHVQLGNLSLRDTLPYCDRFACDIVTFLKRVPDFRALDISDQTSLLKANSMLCMMLKSSVTFCEEQDAWFKDFGPLRVDVFARMTEHEDVVSRYASFSRTLKRILKDDYTAYALITCFVLFEPQVVDVLDHQAVNVLQDKYSTMLKHYLQSQYSYIFATQYYEAIQDSIYQGKILAVDMTNMFSKWKPYLRPLMIEVINLS